MTICKGCSQPIVIGQLRRGDEHHHECHPLYLHKEVPAQNKRHRLRPQREPDIKAPDGYTLGGIRRVRKDGTILFNRGYWQAPEEWAGQDVWVHEEWMRVDGQGEHLFLEVAQPGYHIYEARGMTPQYTVICEPADRPDAKKVKRRK